jgi:hypothetical protein
VVNVDRFEIDDALEDLEDEKETQTILERMRQSDQFEFPSFLNTSSKENK